MKQAIAILICACIEISLILVLFVCLVKLVGVCARNKEEIVLWFGKKLNTASYQKWLAEQTLERRNRYIRAMAEMGRRQHFEDGVGMRYTKKKKAIKRNLPSWF